MGLIEHIEAYLGNISEGWKDNKSTNGLQVVVFREVPAIAESVYMTLGLSHHELVISEGKKVRQELVLAVRSIGVGGRSDHIVSCLLAICEMVLRHHAALLRGQVIRLPEQIARIIGFEAMYCAIPVFLDTDFATFRDSKPPTIIVWVIPIHCSEADFVDANGWDKFEDILESEDPDLFSFERRAVV